MKGCQVQISNSTLIFVKMRVMANMYTNKYIYLFAVSVWLCLQCSGCVCLESRQFGVFPLYGIVK